MRLDGHALRSAVRYALEKVRCSACGQVCTAAHPVVVLVRQKRSVYTSAASKRAPERSLVSGSL